MLRKHPAHIVGLVLDDAKAIVAVAQADNGSQIRITGVGESYVSGLKNESSFDIALVADAIKKALKKAGTPLGGRRIPACAGFGCAWVSLRKCNITADKVNKYSEPLINDLPVGEKIISLILSREQQDFIKSGLTREVQVVSTDNRNINLLKESARLAGLAISRIMYAPIAAAEVLLDDVEKELGTLLIDFGGSKTTVSIIHRRLIRESAVLSIGGEHIITDLAIGAHTTLNRAREIFRFFSINRDNRFEHIDNVPFSLIDSIVTAREKEIIKLIADTVDSFVYTGRLPGGTVLYGDDLHVKALSLLVENNLRLAVRIGIPRDTELALSSCYANVCGLAKHGFSLADL